MFANRPLRLMTAAAMALISVDAALAGPMIVRSSGPSAKSYPVGKPLSPTDRLTLKAGDVVTVLDSGGTRVLKGPGMIAVAGSGATTSGGFGQLIASGNGRQSRTGATRSGVTGGAVHSPNVWHVDASRGGLQCVANPTALSVWRPDTSSEAKITISRVSDGKSVVLDFPISLATRAWPTTELPVTEGGEYRITFPGGKPPVTVKTVLVSQPEPSLESVAATLLPKGCTNQMDALVEGSTRTG